MMSVHYGLLLLLCSGWSLSQDTSTTKQTYIAVFMENYVFEEAKMNIHLVTTDEAANIDVTVMDPTYHRTVYVGSSSSTIVTLPEQYMISGTGISSKVITVTSDVDITVFAFNTAPLSSDATFILSGEDLGTEYFIFTPKYWYENMFVEFAVATGVDRIDRVAVTVSGSLTYNGKSYSTGDTFSFSLAPYQVIQFQSPNDLSGTRVVSSAPVAVFTGYTCYAGPTTCDVLFQQLHPVSNWGTSFFVFPVASHTKDIVDIMAAYADTTMKINEKEHTLQPGSHLRYTIDKSIFVNSSKPVWVSYLSQDSFDPFLTAVPPLQMIRQHYRFVTDSFYNNYITVVSQESSLASEFYLDQKPLSQYSFSTKEMNGFRMWDVLLGKVHGVHEIFHKSSPFSIYVYGYEYMISYGYTMGLETAFPESHLVGPPVVPPVFNCYPHGGEFHLPRFLVFKAKLNISDVHLKDPTCKGTKKRNYVLINVPFNRCGSKVLNKNGKSIYENTVYGTVPSSGVHRIEFPLKCEMNSNKTLEWNLCPQVTDMASLGDYNVSLKFYEDEAFNDPITEFPCEIDLHSRLYVQFEVESKAEDLQIFVENCQAAPSLEETEEKNYKVIREGCYEDSTLEVHPVSDQRFQRFSFHVFKFEDLEKVYLSCNVIICHNGTSPNRCTEGCLHRRRRRDVHSFINSVRLSQGPIIVSSGDPLWNNQPANNTLAYALIAVIGVMGMLSVMGLMILKHHYRRKLNNRT